MGTFLMICAVAAEFLSPDQSEVFKVTSDKIGTFVQAPNWVKETLLFSLLLKDGSIKVALTNAQQKILENAPLEGLGADGKAITEEETTEGAEAPEEGKEPEAEPVKKTRTRKAKGDAE